MTSREYENWESEKQKQGSISYRLFKNPKPIHLILLGIATLIAIALYNKNPDNLKNILIILLIAFLVYIFVLSRSNPKQEVIPRKLAQDIAQEDLNNEIESSGIFPQGTTIIPTGYCKLQSINSGDGKGWIPINWNLGFKIQVPKKAPKHIVYSMHPYNGNCKGIKEQRMQYLGEETKDVQFLPGFTENKKETKESEQT